MITYNDWIAKRQEIVENVTSKFERIDPRSLSGEGISENVINTAMYFSDASQSKNASYDQNCKLFFVTEGRHVWKGYSTCADLAHCILSMNGVTDPTLVNRDDDNWNGYIEDDEKMSAWKVSVNVSKLVYGAPALEKKYGKQFWIKRTLDIKPRPGDIVIIGEGGLEHVLVACSWGDNVLTSVDAGQVDEGGQCVKIRKRKLIEKNGLPYLSATDTGPSAAGLGTRVVVGWIDTATLISECSNGNGLLR